MVLPIAPVGFKTPFTLQESIWKQIGGKRKKRKANLYLGPHLGVDMQSRLVPPTTPDLPWLLEDLDGTSSTCVVSQTASQGDWSMALSLRNRGRVKFKIEVVKSLPINVTHDMIYTLCLMGSDRWIQLRHSGHIWLGLSKVQRTRSYHIMEYAS